MIIINNYHNYDVQLAQIENEENVLVCLRIIIELHKQFRPPLQSEASSNSKVINYEMNFWLCEPVGICALGSELVVND